jgi:hypothetical protein
MEHLAVLNMGLCAILYTVQRTESAEAERGLAAAALHKRKMHRLRA